jgi:ABC-type amino acid transport substrate-binding protein
MLTLGINPEEYETVFSLKKMDLYIGLNRDTDPALVTALQRALDKMKQPVGGRKSRLEQIVDKYLVEE